MNKRITSLLLCFVMMVSMLVTAVPAYALSTEAPITVTIEPDKTTASPGDTITYTVKVGPVKRLQSVNFTLVIPEGLTYVSGKEVDGLKELLGADKAEYTDSTKTMIVSGGGSYNSDETTELMKFSCTVNAGTVGTTLKITFDGDEDFSDAAYETYDTTYDFDSSQVTIVAAPKPATSIKLNKSTATIYTGANETLIATVKPDDTTDTVTWKSSNTDVAAVDSTGKVTAVAPGTATITATAGSQSATCTVTVENAPCTHTSQTNVGEQASTCKEKGWDAYSKCNDCGQLFNMDGDKISAIPYRPLGGHTAVQTATAEYLKSAATCTSADVYYEHCSVCDVKLNTTFTSGNPLPHTQSGWKSDADGHWKECTVCGTVTTTKVAHTPDHEGHATEEYAIRCTICGWEIEAQVDHVHKMTEVKGKLATCTEAGSKAYYVCSGCSKWFEDATGNVEITDHSSVVIGKLGHDWVDATCTAPKTCERCDITEGFALGHNYAREWSSDADGHWHACTRCDDKIDQDEHTPDRGEATETEPVLCTICGYEIVPVLTLDYTVKVIDGSGSGIYRAGSEVSVTAASKFGQVFDGWVVLEGNVVINNTKDKTITFTMPREDVVLAATYSSNILSNYLPRLYQVKITAGEGGTFSPRDLYRLAAGGDQLVQFIPNEGYEVADVMVNGVSIGAVEKYLILDIDRDTNIRVTFSKIINMPFHDVDKDDWFYEDVAYVYENNLMVGFSEVKFAPNVSANRAMIVTILWRLEGEPAAAAAGFVDVAADAWYADAVAWAAENGIVLGYGDSIFAPEDSITREQMLAILHRYAAYKGWDEGTSASMAAQYECSDWAENDVNWAELNGLLEGIEVDLSDMTKEASRAEIAAVLHAFCETIVK